MGQTANSESWEALSCEEASLCQCHRIAVIPHCWKTGSTNFSFYLVGIILEFWLRKWWFTGNAMQFSWATSYLRDIDKVLTQLAIQVIHVRIMAGVMAYKLENMNIFNRLKNVNSSAYQLLGLWSFS